MLVTKVDVIYFHSSPDLCAVCIMGIFQNSLKIHDISVIGPFTGWLELNQIIFFLTAVFSLTLNENVSMRRGLG